jgi:hypothetical protein
VHMPVKSMILGRIKKDPLLYLLCQIHAKASKVPIGVRVHSDFQNLRHFVPEVKDDIIGSSLNAPSFVLKSLLVVISIQDLCIVKQLLVFLYKNMKFR